MSDLKQELERLKAAQQQWVTKAALAKRTQDEAEDAFEDAKRAIIALGFNSPAEAQQAAQQKREEAEALLATAREKLGI